MIQIWTRFLPRSERRQKAFIFVYSNFIDTGDKYEDVVMDDCHIVAIPYWPEKGENENHKRASRFFVRDNYDRLGRPDKVLGGRIILSGRTRRFFVKGKDGREAKAE